ncbi:MAG TPA: aldo/keto reductase [Conexibacter sp.]|nr:aldo/keto reductase [Conexibacter sp.]
MRAEERAALGSTAVRVTRLGFGAAPLGNLFEPLDDAVARATVERAWELGVRLFDTAPVYGYGLAEERLRDVLPGRPRDELVLSTKVGRLLRADVPADEALAHLFKDHPAVNSVFDFSCDGVLRSVEESLERLGLDRVDVLHLHDPDDHYEAALSGAYPALDRLRSEGVIGAVGAGMTQVAMLARFAREADFDCFLLAGRYTLLDHDGLAELLPVCEERNVSLIVGGVYNTGILAGPTADATFDYVQAPQELIERARRLDAVCARHGVPLKAAAIQFPLGSPLVASVLIGCRSVAEIEENVRMYELPIPAELWDELRAERLLADHVPVPRM